MLPYPFGHPTAPLACIPHTLEVPHPPPPILRVSGKPVLHSPPTTKQMINRAELCAIIAVIQQFCSMNRIIAIALDSGYVYPGLQGAACTWWDNGWISVSGPISNVDLWQ